MEIPRKEDLNPATCTERSMNIHYPEFAEYLRTTYKQEGLKWTERLYLYYSGQLERPVCVVCGAPVKFYNMNVGYARTCSRKCNGVDPATREKVRQTSLKKFGVANAAQSKQIQEKMAQTCMVKYGTTNGGWSKEAQAKIKTTNRKKYGTDFPMQNESIRQKAIQTNEQRYGVRHNSQRADIKLHKEEVFKARYGGTLHQSPVLSQHIKETCMERYGVANVMQKDLFNKYPDLLDINGSEWIMSCPHPECTKCQIGQYTTNGDLYRARLRLGTETCTNLLPVQSTYSGVELEVRGWLDDAGVEYITNDRTVLNGQEIDIYIPSLKVGIECNGVFWHSSKFKPSNYHINKTRLANASGLRLYHIWEDWTTNSPQVIKSMVLNWVGKSPNRIYARKCEVRPVDRAEGMNFLEHNHIQGRSPYSVGYGLYYNGQLVSLMTFGGKRGCVGSAQDKGVSGEWELIRFCSVLNTSVIGAAGKLLKHFISHHHPDMIYSYASGDISVGGVYKTLGFVSDGKITPSYWYIDPVSFKRYHRTSFTKSAIVKRGWKEQVDSSWTEKQAMEEQGFHCIYDAGQTKWILKIQKDAE